MKLQKTNDNREPCIRCGNDTGYMKDTPVELRNRYIDGAGQLCEKCYAALYECECAKKDAKDIEITDKTDLQKISDFLAGGGKSCFSLTKGRMILGREDFPMEEKKQYPKTPVVRIIEKFISAIVQIDRHKIPIYGGLFGVHIA